MFPITAEEGKNRFEYAIINENHVVMHYSDGFFDLAGVDTTKDLSKHLPIFANGLERLEKTKKPLRLNQQDPFLHYTLEPFVHRDEELFFVTLTNSEYVRALHKNIDL
ncbi:hypothetical protein, partial [Desulfovibrio sp.]|uniref:hypothetical protein n=1 Tax=Desulfovibrio sp. TaxID=885 RepID=UPI0025BF431B